MGIVQDNDLVITMGAGNIWQVADEIVTRLEGARKTGADQAKPGAG